MKFSWNAYFAVCALVLASAVISFREGTVLNRKVTMGFFNHAGMWGDFTLMAAVAGLVWPHTKLIPINIPFLIFSFIGTVAIHFMWARAMQQERVTSHIFPTHEAGVWYKDISLSGWMHVVVMMVLLYLVFMFIFSPVPKRTTVVVSVFLMTHVFLATVQPGWFCTHQLWRWENFNIPIFATALIWIVALYKTKSANYSF